MHADGMNDEAEREELESLRSEWREALLAARAALAAEEGVLEADEIESHERRLRGEYASAADELRTSSTSLSDPHRMRARQFLERASAPPGSPGGGPPGPIGGIRDQLQNLQQRHNEQIQDTDRDQ